jgi:hypothetical protein
MCIYLMGVHLSPIFDAQHFSNLLFSGTYLKKFIDVWDLRKQVTEITSVSERISDSTKSVTRTEDPLLRKIRKLRTSHKLKSVLDIIRH